GDDSEPIRTTLELKGEVTWTVEKVRSDGGATCVMTIDWLTAEMTGPGGEVEHNDTRKGQGDSAGLFDTLKAMTGAPLRFEVSDQGVVEKVAGVDAIKKAVGEDGHAPEELDFIETASDLATLPGAPDSALAPGKGWSIDFDWTHELGMMHHTMKYTLTGIEEIAGIPVATVTGHSDPVLKFDKKKLGEDA